jgi:hypothetical protein
MHNHDHDDPITKGRNTDVEKRHTSQTRTMHMGRKPADRERQASACSHTSTCRLQKVQIGRRGSQTGQLRPTGPAHNLPRQIAAAAAALNRLPRARRLRQLGKVGRQSTGRSRRPYDLSETAGWVGRRGGYSSHHLSRGEIAGIRHGVWPRLAAGCFFHCLVSSLVMAGLEARGWRGTMDGGRDDVDIEWR